MLALDTAVGEPLRQRLLRREFDLANGIHEPPLNVVQVHGGLCQEPVPLQR